MILAMVGVFLLLLHNLHAQSQKLSPFRFRHRLIEGIRGIRFGSLLPPPVFTNAPFQQLLKDADLYYHLGHRAVQIDHLMRGFRLMLRSAGLQCPCCGNSLPTCPPPSLPSLSTKRGEPQL